MKEGERMDTKNLYDLIILGSGSAGMSAGIYAGRARLKTLVIDKARAGGQISITNEVANYPGVLNISGPELSDNMKKQAQSFGAKFLDAEVTAVDLEGDIKTVRTTNGDYKALSVIAATGAVPRVLGFKGEQEFRGRGIGYCATCDGEFFTGMDVFVIGGGYAAAEEAVFLTRYAKKVRLIVREPDFTCARAVAEKALNHPKIEVFFNTEIVEVGGDNVLKYAEFVNNQTGERTRYEVPEGDLTFGVFIFAGYVPQSKLFEGVLELDEFGYVKTDEDMRTNIEGVFAAGDIRPKKLRQLVTAVADGAIAAIEAEKYVNEKKRQLGIAETEESGEENADGEFLDDEIKEQLKDIFERFERKVTIAAVLEGDEELSSELKGFLTDFAALSDKVELKFISGSELKALGASADVLPTAAVLDADGKYTGMQFGGVPGGHEFNSFVIALYNAAGPGQEISDETMSKISSINKKANLKIGISLSCPLCPDVVAASQLIALKNRNVEAQMVDISRFPEIKNKYAIMSVPALIVNDEKVHFGKKSIEEIAAIIMAES
jgi:thioredoxin reductase (NADPH)